MKSGRIISDKTGLLTKGSIHDKTSRKSSSIVEADALTELGKLPLLVQNTESTSYENTYRIKPEETNRFSPVEPSPRDRELSSLAIEVIYRHVSVCCREPSISYIKSIRIHQLKRSQSTARVKEIADRILHEMLRDMDYDPQACRELSLDISDMIVRQVSCLGFSRYKIVCLTMIGQKMAQTVRVGSLCCWDPKVDNFAESVFVNRTMFAVSVVYGMYQE